MVAAEKCICVSVRVHACVGQVGGWMDGWSSTPESQWHNRTIEHYILVLSVTLACSLKKNTEPDAPMDLIKKPETH